MSQLHIEPTSAPLTRRRLLLPALVLTLGACGTPGALASEQPSEQPAGLPFNDAFGQRVEATVGYPVQEVQFRTEVARYDDVARCVSEQGWDAALLSSPRPVRFDLRPAEVIGYRTFRAISQLEATDASAYPRPTQPDGFLTVEEACTQRAKASEASPLAELDATFDRLGTEIADQVSADPRVLAANTEYERCLADADRGDRRARANQASHDARSRTSAELDVYYVNATNEILNNVAIGATSKSQALDDLRAMHEQEIADLGPADECLLDQQLVVYNVTNEFQQAALDDNAAEIDALLEAASPNVATLVTDTN